MTLLLAKIKKKPKFVDDFESAKYYDSFPRFSKNVYEFLEKIGLHKKKIADVGSGTGRIAIDLLESENKALQKEINSIKLVLGDMLGNIYACSVSFDIDKSKKKK